MAKCGIEVCLFFYKIFNIDFTFTISETILIDNLICPR